MIEFPDFIVWELEMRDCTVEEFILELVEIVEEEG